MLFRSGQRVRKGDILKLIVFSANFAEEQFDNAEYFAIERCANSHLTFGHGIHYCVGAQLVRLEMRTVLEQMIAHFHQWKIVNPEHLEQIDSEILFGLKSLPMCFQ